MIPRNGYYWCTSNTWMVPKKGNRYYLKFTDSFPEFETDPLLTYITVHLDESTNRIDGFLAMPGTKLWDEYVLKSFEPDHSEFNLNIEKLLSN